MDGNSQHPYSVDVDSFEENGTTDEEDGITEQLSVKQLQHLVHLLDASDVSEIEVKCADTGMRLVLRKAKVREQAGSSDYQMLTPPLACPVSPLLASPLT